MDPFGLEAITRWLIENELNGPALGTGAGTVQNPQMAIPYNSWASVRPSMQLAPVSASPLIPTSEVPLTPIVPSEHRGFEVPFLQPTSPVPAIPATQMTPAMWDWMQLLRPEQDETPAREGGGGRSPRPTGGSLGDLWGGGQIDTSILGPALSLGGLAIPGLGLLGTGINIWNGLQFDEARSALGLPGLSVGDWIAQALGLGDLFGVDTSDPFAGALARSLSPAGTQIVQGLGIGGPTNPGFGGRTAGGALDIRPHLGGSGRGGRTGGMDGSNAGAATGPGLGGLY